MRRRIDISTLLWGLAFIVASVIYWLIRIGRS